MDIENLEKISELLLESLDSRSIFNNHNEIFENAKRYFIKALAMNGYIKKEINLLYNEKEDIYYKEIINFNNSEKENDISLKCFDAVTQEYINKVIGIVQYNYGKNNNVLEKLVKQGYRKLYTYVKNAKVVDIHKSTNYLMKNSVVSNQDIKNATAISIFLTIFIFEKDYDLDIKVQELIMYVYKNDINEKRTYLNRFVIIDDYKDEVGELYKCFELNPYEKIKEKDLFSFLCENSSRRMHKIMIEEEKNLLKLHHQGNILKRKEPKELEELVKGNLKNSFLDDLNSLADTLCNSNVLTNLKIKDQAKEKASKVLVKDTILKQSIPINDFLKCLGYSLTDIQQDVNFNNDILNMIFGETCTLIEDDILNETSKDLFIMYSLTLYSLIEKYNKLKENYLNINYQEKNNKITLKEKSVLEREQSLQVQKEELHLKEQKMILKNEELNKKNSELEKKVKKLEELLKEKEDNALELMKLRELAYTTDEVFEEYNECNKTKEEKISELRNEKIIIFGGHITWKNRLKDIFRNGIFMSVDEMNRDLTFIKNYDNIFINVIGNKHAFTKKITSYAEKYDKKLYLTKTNNLDLFIDEIYSKLKKDRKM